MKREGLRRRLALATIEILHRQRLNVANVKRYVIPSLNLYCICKKEKISAQDMRIALSAVNQSLLANEPAFRFGVGEDWAMRRENYFLTRQIFSNRF